MWVCFCFVVQKLKRKRKGGLFGKKDQKQSINGKLVFCRYEPYTYMRLYVCLDIDYFSVTCQHLLLYVRRCECFSLSPLSFLVLMIFFIVQLVVYNYLFIYYYLSFFFSPVVNCSQLGFEILSFYFFTLPNGNLLLVSCNALQLQ